MKTTEFWAGDGGSAYTERNRVDWRKRTSFWRDTIPHDVDTVFEVGTNLGANLRAIRACRGVKVQGIELNQSAVDAARARGLAVVQQDLLTMQAFPLADFVFTCGCLIHISPDSVWDAMEQVAALSKKWIMAVEYEASAEEMIQYRGASDLLWRRNYGAMYQEMGLILHSKVDAGAGFDRCTAWLLRKSG